MKHAILAALGLVAGVGMALGVGCDTQSKLNVMVEEGANAPRVNLPRVPTIPPPPHPVQYPDGAYSIYGLRHAAARNWTKQVTVRGHVVYVYTPYVPNSRPPRVCREQDRCEEERPHIYIADTASETDPEKRMMVTGYATYQWEIDTARTAAARGRPNPQANTPLAQQGLVRTFPTDLLEGAQVTVTGSFVRRASNGQADSNGLIEYARHTTNTPAPPPSPAPRSR
jgi:hypothetical protein